MRFEWDPRKSVRNLLERGFDFAFATQVFDGITLEREDRRREYGEPRVIAIGMAASICLTVVFTDRDSRGLSVRRIISARRSNRREREAYAQALGTGS